VTYPASQPSAAAPQGAYTVPPPHVYPALAPDGRPLASFGDRFVARIIDFLVAIGVSIVLIVPFMILMFGAIASESAELIALALVAYAAIFVLSLVFSYVYEVELPRKTGQTWGKRVAKIHVVPIAPGAVLTREILVRRWLIWGLGGSLVPFLIWIDGLWQLWDKPYLQCLHDKVAETVVVKAA
jgi:uncharacterized RDD family membrane protein YckC